MTMAIVAATQTDAPVAFYIVFRFFTGLGGEQDAARRWSKRWSGRRRQDNILSARRTIHGSENHGCQPLHDRSVVLGECVRLGGENLEQSNDFFSHADGCGQHGTQPEGAAGVTIDATIGLRIVAAQKFPAANTFSREAGTYLQLGADGRGVWPRAGAAEHETGIGGGQSYGCARGSHQDLSPRGHQLQRRGNIETKRLHLALNRG
jgi:hypothetical protein